MVLARVWYELFAWEAEWLDQHPDFKDAKLGRQLRLVMVDGSNVFVAWTWGPCGDDFGVGIAPHSFCTGSPEVDREMSASPLWAPLVGNAVELVYRDAEHQVVEVRAGSAVVYCCSFGQGMWGMDELRISGHIPKQSPYQCG